MTISRLRILSLLGCYIPGLDASGPNQSFRAFANGLREQMDICCVASNPMGGKATAWRDDGYTFACQLPRGLIAARGLRQLLCETPHDVLMLNGFNDREFTIPTLIWRKLGLIPRVPTILSPRGEFAAGALSLKGPRKRAWLMLVRALGLTRDVWLHATADHERGDIERLNLPCRGIVQAPNARGLADLPVASPRALGTPLRVAALGRVTPVKNLHFALDVLSRVSRPVNFNIFGPLDDPDYVSKLERQVATLPDHVTVRFAGTLAHKDVAQTLAGHDLFFLPSMGENFGHAINEALGAGLPVLIADTTPWRALQQANAGWDLPLDEPELFVAAIEEMATMAPSEVRRMRAGARALAERSFSESDAIAANLAMIQNVLEMDAHD